MTDTKEEPVRTTIDTRTGVSIAVVVAIGTALFANLSMVSSLRERMASTEAKVDAQTVDTREIRHTLEDMSQQLLLLRDRVSRVEAKLGAGK